MKDMTSKEKSLLLKDLSARLPYGTIVSVTDGTIKYEAYIESISYKNIEVSPVSDSNFTAYTFYKISEIKPYLRLLSSMTEEEARELGALHDIKDILSVKVTSVYIDYIVDDGVCTKSITTLWCDELISSVECLDWLNSKHFDYRGLILKGLAIAVTEDNNPY